MLRSLPATPAARGFGLQNTKTQPRDDRINTMTAWVLLVFYLSLSLEGSIEGGSLTPSNIKPRLLRCARNDGSGARKRLLRRQKALPSRNDGRGKIASHHAYGSVASGRFTPSQGQIGTMQNLGGWCFYIKVL